LCKSKEPIFFINSVVDRQEINRLGKPPSLLLIPPTKNMVRTLNIISIAAATIMGSATAFSPVTTSIASVRSSQAQAPLHAVAEAPAIERLEENYYTDYEEDMLPEERWHLILHNDKQNTKEWVAHALHFVVGLSEEQAYHVMQNAHKNGKAFVGTYIYDVAECYQKGMGKNGIKCDVIPAEGFQ
jgi:ATP-dependent Clp protease adapter protein ClpS